VKSSDRLVSVGYPTIVAVVVVANLLFNRSAVQGIAETLGQGCLFGVTAVAGVHLISRWADHFGANATFATKRLGLALMCMGLGTGLLAMRFQLTLSGVGMGALLVGGILAIAVSTVLSLSVTRRMH